MEVCLLNKHLLACIVEQETNLRLARSFLFGFRSSPLSTRHLHTSYTMGNGRAVIFCTFIAFGGFLFGYDIGVISGCLVMPDFINRFGENGVLTTTHQSEITSLLSAGTFFGALGQAFTADSLGRKGSMIFWSVLFTIGVIIQTAAETSRPQLLVGRLIAGFGIGALSALVPLYNGEASPRHLRGTLLVLYQTMIIAGLFSSYLIDWGTHHFLNSASWRIPVGLQILFGLVLIFGALLLPESPRHLLFKGHGEQARAALASLNNCPPDSPLVDDVVAELEEGLRAENEGGKATWLECFSPDVRWRTINGMMLQFLQQLNGQNFYYYYGAVFFNSAGTGLDSYEIQVVLGGVSFALIFPALYLIETMGRRKSLLTGAAVEAVCALIAGLVGHFTLAPDGTPADQLTSSQQAGGKVLVAFAVLQVGAFSLWWGPTPWVYLGESFPMRVRSKCIALGAATNWLWNFLLGYFAPRIAKDIGPAILLIFFGMLVVAFVYTYFFVHEVKGLSLEQVDELYKSDTRPWRSASWQPTMGASRKKAFQRTLYASEQKALDTETGRLDAERIEAAKQRTFGAGVGAEKDGKPSLEMKEHA
ncbi:and other transporter-domain-containing protein [Leucosporidium creatinivorum]|uniref:And other transporter-domain-containing protein n=1 Tax=Leucosporidium creatinivorum TaxID=106004 RepID=A0A1Y2G3Z2_9BASI|nr:and other transporter-domain-containing protein [Leucosporidium creatinivorum]